MSLPSKHQKFLQHCPHFFPDISRQEAEELLQSQQQPKIYLLRTSSQPSSIACTIYSSKLGIGHLLIYCSDTACYFTRTKDPAQYPSLDRLLEKSPDLIGYEPLSNKVRIETFKQEAAEQIILIADKKEGFLSSSSSELPKKKKPFQSTHSQSGPTFETGMDFVKPPPLPTVSIEDSFLESLERLSELLEEDASSTKPVTSPKCRKTDFIPFCERCRAPLKDRPEESLCLNCQNYLNAPDDAKKVSTGFKDKFIKTVQKTKKKLSTSQENLLSQPPTPKQPAPFKSQIFGKSFGEIPEKFCTIYDRIPDLFVRAIDYCHDQQVWKEEGIFRLSGSTTRVNEINQLIEEGRYNWKEPDESNITSLLKNYLRELPSHLFSPISNLMRTMYSRTDLLSPESIKKVGIFMEQLPQENYIIAKLLFGLLFEVQKNQLENRMSASNLSIVFQPTLHYPDLFLQCLILFPDKIFTKPLPARKNE